MNSNAKTYYAKLHTDFNSNIKNTLTLYGNMFTRDWYKLDKANGASLNQIVSKAYGTPNNFGNYINVQLLEKLPINPMIGRIMLMDYRIKLILISQLIF